MQNLIIILVIVNIVWLAGVSFVVFRLQRTITSAFHTDADANIVTVVGEIRKTIAAMGKQHEQLDAAAAKLQESADNHLQRIGFVRFNPFSETGGDQSFSVSLLNNHGTGVVLTGLHGRDRARMYAKPIVNRKSSTALAKEEVQAIEKAFKNI